MYDKQIATEFAKHVVSKGFTVYMAESGTYGFLTDNSEKRALSFGVDLGSIKLSGNFKHASRERGRGWRFKRTVHPRALTPTEISDYLYAQAPKWALIGTTGTVEYATVADMLKQWGSSSKYQKFGDLIMLTRKDFKELAAIAKNIDHPSLPYNLAEWCKSRNPIFDANRFMLAAGVPACPKCKRADAVERHSIDFCTRCNIGFDVDGPINDA